MSYQEWRRQWAGTIGDAGAFWAIIDHNWTPSEQSQLARLWKAWASD